MIRHTYPARVKRRSGTSALVLLTIILGLVLLLSGWPFVVSLVGFSTATAIDTGPPVSTELVRLEPERALEARPGTCAVRSAVSPRQDAWRCDVEGQLFDPCFEATSLDHPKSVVCAAEPLSDKPGFRILDLVPPDAVAEAPPLAPASLGDLYYLLDLIGTPVKLAGGQYYAPFIEATGQGVLVAQSAMRASGDLDGDGDEDAAVILVADANDDRMFIYLGVVRNDGGVPGSTTTVLLGDRIKVDHMDIRSGQVVVRLTTHTGDDPECCPTLDTTQYYTLQGERLVQYLDGWRLELQGGTQCVPVETPSQVEPAQAAKPFAYQCSDGAWLRSGLRPGQVWLAEPLGRAPSALDAVIGGSAGVDEASPYLPVVRLWQ